MSQPMEPEVVEGAAHTDVTVHVPVTVDLLNTDLGIIRVGELLKRMDITACMSAERHSLCTAVTLSMDDVNFKDLRAQPGELLVLRSRVNRTFTSSMEVGLRVCVEQPTIPGTAGIRHLCSSYFVFVALDAATGSKVRVPVLVPQTDREKVRWTLAQDRRQIRLDHAKIIANVVKNTLPTGSSSRHTSMQRYSQKSTAVEPGREDENTITQMVLPQHANHHGNTFGGVIMQWASEICETVAMRHCHMRVVPVSVDDMYFLSPSKVGARIVFKASVNRVFHRSMEVGIRVEAHSLDGTVALINKAYVTVDVAQDLGLLGPVPVALFPPAAAAAKKKDSTAPAPAAAPPIHQVVLRTEESKVRFREAMGRRRVRLERLQLKSGSQLAWEFTPETTDPREFALENLRALERAAMPDEVLGAGNSRGTWGLLSVVDGVELYSKTSMTHGVSIKSRVVLEQSGDGASSLFDAVVFAVSDCQARRAWDSAVTSYTSCQDFAALSSVQADICHLAVDTSAYDSGGKPTDFVLFRSWKRMRDDATGAGGGGGEVFVMASHSITYKLVPEFPNLLRGQAANSGFIVRQQQQQQLGSSSKHNTLQHVEIQYVMQLNTGSTSIVAGELVGTSRLASARMKALAEYARSVPVAQVQQSKFNQQSHKTSSASSTSSDDRHARCVVM